MTAWRFAGAILAASLVGASPSLADTTFYQGKTVTLISGNSAGGGYDTYARLLLRHIRKYIPGQPNLVVQNMPGAGGMIAANHIANVASRDGTVFALFPASTLLDAVLGKGAAKFAPDTFTPIGNMNAEYDNCVVWRGRGIASADDVFRREVVTGATGQSSNSYVYPALMNVVLGTKFKLITGYPGNERMLVMEKGELDAACGIFTSTLQSTFASHVRAGKIEAILQMGLGRHPALPNVPSALDLAKTEEQRQILRLAFSPLEMGRSFFAPPGVPADRAQALQKAFRAAMTDRELLEEGAKANMELRWFDAARLTEIIRGMASSPEAVRAKVRSLL